ncbi:MAG: 16S rRNA (cytosine(967)-C(5))-methyltransferase RsmB, partial [Bacillota bacterium]|nr:16S rRNA (cytosine(967)-C(5))-methyltransferase RsmB [Bacillota bacterium]
MNSRQIAVKILRQILEEGAYSNIVLRNSLNKYELKEQDRGLITEIVYGTLKYRYTIDSILSSMVRDPLDKVDKDILNILRISIYQFRYLDKVPEYAVVNEGVNLAKKVSLGAGKFVNGVLRNYLRSKEGDFKVKPGIINELCFKYSFEKWMVKLFLDQYGREAAEKILNGLNSIPPVTIRINTLKSNYDDVFKRLVELNYTAEEGEVCPEAVKLIKGSSVENNPLFKEGLFTVQDESAMLASLALDVREGMKVLDICAAPGGKSTHMAELMNDEGSIYSVDLYEHKVKLIGDNASRLGIHNIEPHIMDAGVFNEKLVEKFDRVLVDAPCSGLGIIRKKP